MNPVSLPAAGFHHDVPYEVYAKWPAINFSKLKPIRDTASKCKYEMDNPKQPTPAMILGSALHVATLEPARFEQLFYICPPCDRRTVEGKEIYAKAEREAAGKQLIRSGVKEDEALTGQIADLRGMAASIRSRTWGNKYINAPGRNEVSMLWKDEETGLMCKARMDRFLENFMGVPTIVEVKSCRTASEWGFGKDVDERDYDAQSAGYRTGVKVLTGKSADHVFLAVENSAPYDAAEYMLDDQDVQTGLLKYRQMLTRYAACINSGKWPGYPDQLRTLQMPKYAHNRDYTN